MKFQFESLMDFFSMSGHGPYVWASYVITLLAIVAIIVVPYIQQGNLASRLKRQQRIQASVNTSNRRESGK